MRYLLTILVLLIMGSEIVAQVQSDSEISAKAAYIQGLEAFENEEFQRARELLLQARRDLPDAPGVNYALADAYFKMDDLPNAALYGKQAVEADPKNKWFRLQLAEIYRSAGRNNATLEELNMLLEYHPNDVDVKAMLADTYRSYGEFVKSNQVLDDILKQRGNDPQILMLKFRNFESMMLPDSAIAQLEKLREIDPDNLEMLNLLGSYYARDKQYGNAKSVLQEALERNPREPEALIKLAGIYLDEQKWDSAGSRLSLFISDPLIDAEAKMNIARFMYSKTRDAGNNPDLTSQTERVMDSLTVTEADFGPAFTLAGEFYAQSGKTEKALSKLEKANELLPQDEIAWRQRLQLLMSSQRYEEATEVGRKANEQVPEDAYIQFFVGSAHMLMDENTEAERWLENASRAPARRPFKSIIYGTLGDVRANLEQHKESDEAYELALRYDPDNDNAMNNYAYNLSVREVNLDRAEELAIKAMDAAPENAAYLDTMGWIFFKKGEYEKAQRFIKASIETGEASAEVLEHLGDVYEALGNLDEAKAWWKKALKKDSTRTYLQEKINDSK
jgi:tetratricopeptide (TPR) repeat protein